MDIDKFCVFPMNTVTEFYTGFLNFKKFYWNIFIDSVSDKSLIRTSIHILKINFISFFNFFLSTGQL